MSTFCTKTVIYGSPSLIPQIAEHIQKDFGKDGFEVSIDTLCSGGCDISISKGGLFKAVLGMKTALKVTLLPQGGNISFEAGVGIWGQQAIPTIISMLFFWPVLLTQLWGLVKQSQLDDRALAVANEVVNRYYSEASAFSSTQSPASDKGSTKFCTHCGARNITQAIICVSCGKALDDN